LAEALDRFAKVDDALVAEEVIGVQLVSPVAVQLELDGVQTKALVAEGIDRDPHEADFIVPAVGTAEVIDADVRIVVDAADGTVFRFAEDLFRITGLRVEDV